MRNIPATQFKQQCLAILDHVDRDGVVITKHGRPVARLLPIPRRSGDLIGALRGKITIQGDIMSTGERWDAES